MRLASLAAILSVACLLSYGAGLPNYIELTPDAQQKYGFRVAVKLNGNQIDVELTYPNSIDGVWVPSGSVTYLLAGGAEHEPLLASRTDFAEPDSDRTVRAGMPVEPRGNDMAIEVVFRCNVDGSICRRGTMIHYGVSSVRLLVQAERS